MGFLYVSTWIRLMWDGCVRVGLLEQSSQNRNNIFHLWGLQMFGTGLHMMCQT